MVYKSVAAREDFLVCLQQLPFLTQQRVTDIICNTSVKQANCLAQGAFVMEAAFFNHPFGGKVKMKVHDGYKLHLLLR
ncbi:MAG: hypothetical protein LLG09_05605 [Negativicutes bacterium]|nr:hypothetical protein [Negativicutes bacterium]